MFTFRDKAEDGERLARDIRRLLARRQAVHIGELGMRLGVEEEVLRSRLEGLMASGEIENLRPLDYPREDLDFFRLKRPSGTTSGSGGKDYASAIADRVRLAGETVACLVG
jgi:predicted ArsR family transcriptional regulator